MNHASEIFISFEEKTWKQLSNVNTATYSSLTLSKTESATLQQQMVKDVGLGGSTSNFDATKKYQHFYIVRWTTIAIDAILLPMEFTVDGC
jgi:hypothetical protein